MLSCSLLKIVIIVLCCITSVTCIFFSLFLFCIKWFVVILFWGIVTFKLLEAKSDEVLIQAVLINSSLNMGQPRELLAYTHQPIISSHILICLDQRSNLCNIPSPLPSKVANHLSIVEDRLGNTVRISCHSLQMLITYENPNYDSRPCMIR